MVSKKRRSKSDFANGYNYMMNTGIINPTNAQHVLQQMSQASNLPAHEIFKHVTRRKVDIEQAQIEAMMSKL